MGYFTGSISTTYASGTRENRVRRYLSPVLPPTKGVSQLGWSLCQPPPCPPTPARKGVFPISLKLPQVKKGSPIVQASDAKKTLPGHRGSNRWLAENRRTRLKAGR